MGVFLIFLPSFSGEGFFNALKLPTEFLTPTAPPSPFLPAVSSDGIRGVGEPRWVPSRRRQAGFAGGISGCCFGCLVGVLQLPCFHSFPHIRILVLV